MYAVEYNIALILLIFAICVITLLDQSDIHIIETMMRSSNTKFSMKHQRVTNKKNV